MKETADFVKMMDSLSRSVATLPRKVATVAVNFSKERFYLQNWADTTRKPWAKRKKSWNKETNRRSGRAILVDTGRLRRSIRVIHADSSIVAIGTDVPYARAHNDGFSGRVRQKVRAHKRGKFAMVKSGTGTFNIKTRRENTRSRRSKSGEISVKAYTRTIDQKIPQRRFIGPSALLNRRIERMIVAEFKQSLKTI